MNNKILNRADTAVGGVLSGEHVTISDLAQILGTSEEIVSESLKSVEVSLDSLSYRILVGEEKDREILAAIKRIENDKQIVATPERTQVWYNGWAENLREFVASGYDVEALSPKYFRKDKPYRFRQQLIKSDNPNFERDFWQILRTCLFKIYFPPYKTIYEFGCGTGQNLVSLAKIYPDKKIFGLDFVQSSADLVNLIHEKWNLNVCGKVFDMIHPDYDFQLEDNSAIFTSASIEQLGNQYENFLRYLLLKKPALCMNVEPLAEVYELDNLVDYLAYTFHTKRHYTSGYIPLLKKLEADGKIKILDMRRLYFGNMNHEGYNLIVWKPL